jgi:integrase
MPKGERGTARPYLRGNIWWIKYYVPGEKKPRRESSYSENKEDARRLLNKRRKEIDDRKVSPTNATVGHLLDLFLADLRRSKKPWLRSAKGYVKNHLRSVLAAQKAADLTSAHVNSYIDLRQEQGAAPATINRELSCLARSYSLAMAATPPLVSQKPGIEKLPEDNVREGFLDHHQYVLMRDELPDHQKLILVIGYHLGMRRGEILKLRWDQVDWGENVIRLERKQTKAKQARIAPLYGELRVWFEMAYSVRDPECPFIVSWQGHGISEVKTAWKKARIRAGLPELLVHDLRRTAVRNMIRAGIPEKLAMLISGHKTRSVFERYNIIDERDIHDAGQKLTSYLKKKAQGVKVGTKIGTVAKSRNRRKSGGAFSIQ